MQEKQIINPDSDTNIKSALRLQGVLAPLFGKGVRVCFLPDGSPSFVAQKGAATKSVLVASMPKAGTYLLGAFLEQLNLVSTGVHVDVGSFTDYRDCGLEKARVGFRNLQVSLPLDALLPLVQPGQFIVGHLPSHNQVRALFSDFAIIAITREVRAAVVSYMRWVENSGRADDTDTQWLAFPSGPLRTEAFLSSKGKWFINYLSYTSNWFGANVLPLSFETLQGDAGAEAQAAAAWAVAAHVGAKVDQQGAVEALHLALGSETMTYSGGRSCVADYWSAQCEELFESFGGGTLNQRLASKPAAMPNPLVIEAQADSLVEVPDLAAQPTPSDTASVTLPGSVCGWLKKGVVYHDKRALSLPEERMQRFGGVMRDTLFSDNGSVVLSAEKSPYPFLCERVVMLREGEWLRLRAQPDVGKHCHLTVHVTIESMNVVTMRLRLRREEAGSRFFMLQIGGANGFFKSVFDCDTQEVTSMRTQGVAKGIFSHIERLADGDLGISISGLLANGQGSCVRLYLCNKAGSIDSLDADAMLLISDLVLSYRPQDCGLADGI